MIVLNLLQNPWGNLLLEEIFLLSFIYVALWLAQWFLWKNQLISSTTKQKPVAAGDAIQSGNFWIAVITGRFDPSLQAWGFASLLTTSLFPFMTVDFIYRSYILHGSSNLTFSRMGYISDTSAKVVVRYPIATNIEIEYRANSDGMTSEPNSWSKGQTLYTAPLDDFITTFELKYLQPETEYEYRTNASHSGIFSTPPSNPKRLTLVSSSCIKPSFPYNPFGHSLGIKGLSHLSNYLKTTKADMMFFLGDFIYIDLPKRFGYDAEDYQRAYRQVYASPNWSEGLKSMARIHAYDDHEITNNWSGNETGIFKQAIRPFGAYLHHGNPDPVKKGAMYYAFSRGDVSFFVMDTRRYRSPEMMPDGEHKTMLGAEQLAVFKNWLRTTPGWKVVLSSVPFTRNFRAADEEDYWAGYLYEREELLKIMWQTEGVLIITGVSDTSTLNTPVFES
jgi:alkaline phosphatase D